MYDVATIKANCDLRLMVEHDLGAPIRRTVKSLLWRCPFHHERKGSSLIVWRDGWACLGKCQTYGDVFTWFDRYRNIPFSKACSMLDQRNTNATDHRSTATISISESQPPDKTWQQRGWQIVQAAQELLWSNAGSRALEYLLNDRKLQPATIENAQLGYVQGIVGQWRRLFGLNVPCGILIPCVADGNLWAIKVRRAVGDPKYTQIAGGSAHGLFNADSIQPRSTVIFVEGEFDALLAQQELRNQAVVVTLGSAASSLNAYWWSRLISQPIIWIAYDNDEAGRRGAQRLQSIIQRARCAHLPSGKDVTDFVRGGGDLGSWLTTLTK